MNGEESVDPKALPFRVTSYAHQDGVRTLYKFMRYPADGDFADLHRKLRRRVEALISDGELYFPTAAELNDPFEASPHFYSPEGSQEEVFKRYARALRRIHASELGWNDAQVIEAEKWLRERIRTGEMRALADTIEAKWRPLLRSDYPVQCFAATREDIPMWSYYADGHTGVCSFRRYSGPNRYRPPRELLRCLSNLASAVDGHAGRCGR